MRRQAVPGFSHNHPMRYRSVKCNGCLAAVDDEFIERVRDRMAQRKAYKATGLKGEDLRSHVARNRRWIKFGRKKFSPEQEVKIQKLYETYICRAQAAGKDVSTQPKRYCYWLNAVRWGTATAESVRLRMAKESRTRIDQVMAFRAMKYRKQKEVGAINLPTKVGQIG